ncbi:hypothetical protein FH972_013092 [Carpinus fangiana]|uniref:Uncharacterized protein n=1 Tax=Carpinus fangiana TaxID=176857 RepID=A0A5N6R5M7_9ROSI|nr:hypothetical protein FH972_013092 [Carpinus fangiana]
MPTVLLVCFPSGTMRSAGTGVAPSSASEVFGCPIPYFESVLGLYMFRSLMYFSSFKNPAARNSQQ